MKVFIRMCSAVGPSLHTDANFAKSNSSLMSFSFNVFKKLSIVLKASNDVSFNPIT